MQLNFFNLFQNALIYVNVTKVTDANANRLNHKSRLNIFFCNPARIAQLVAHGLGDWDNRVSWFQMGPN